MADVLMPHSFPPPVALSDPLDDGPTPLRLPRHARFALLPRAQPVPDPRKRAKRVCAPLGRHRRVLASRTRRRVVLVVPRGRFGQPQREQRAPSWRVR